MSEGIFGPSQRRTFSKAPRAEKSVGPISTETIEAAIMANVEFLRLFTQQTAEQQADTAQPTAQTEEPTQDQYTPESNHGGLPTLDQVIANAAANGEEVIDIIVPTTPQEPITEAPASHVDDGIVANEADQAPNQDNIFTRLKTHKRVVAGFTSLALVAGGIVFANNDTLNNWVQGITADKEAAKEANTIKLTKDQLAVLVDKLPTKTAIDKPINPTPVAIGETQSPSIVPEIFTPVDYSYTSTGGTELTLSGGLRLALEHPLVQFQYAYDQKNLAKNATIDAETGALIIQPSAIKIKMSLLQGANDSQTPQKASPIGPESYAWGIANVAGKNEVVVDKIKEQNPEFNTTDITTIVNALNANQVAIGNTIIRESADALWSNPVFVTAFSEALHAKISQDINDIMPGAQLAPIIIGKDTVDTILDSVVKTFPVVKVVDGVKATGEVGGLKQITSLNE